MYSHVCYDLPLPSGFNDTLFDAMSYMVSIWRAGPLSLQRGTCARSC